MIPSPAELTYFLEVANALNLSRASERLGISQPSLSLAIKRLEVSVGTSLFIRHKQGVTLTQAGKQLVLHVRQLLQYWEETRSRALASHKEVQGCYILGCHSTIGIHTVSEILPELLKAHPRLEIELRHEVSRKITEQVINLSIDVGIVSNPIKHPDLIITKLCDDQVTFWTGSHANHTTLLCDPELTQTQSLLKQLKKRKMEFKRIITMNSLEVVAVLTAKGAGIGILPSRVAQAMYPHVLKRIPETPVYKDELCLIYRNEHRNIHAIKVITQTIKHHNFSLS